MVSKGLADLERHEVTEEALLVLIAKSRLRALGFLVHVPSHVAQPYEHALYEVIEKRSPLGAHAAYNALIQRIVSFASAYCQVRDS